MRYATFALIVGALLVSACGGGGGGGGSGGGNGGSSGPPPLPSVTVTLTPPSVSIEANEGESAYVTLDAVYTSPTSGSIAPDIAYDQSVLTLASGGPGAGGYHAQFTLKSGMSPGIYNGEIVFRLCEFSTCSRVYPQSTKTFTYRIDVRFGEWRGFNRTPTNANFVDITLNASRFTKVWERPVDADNQYVDVATEGGVIAVTETSASNLTLLALRDTDGQVQWSQRTPNSHAVSGFAPQTSGGRIFWPLDDIVVPNERIELRALDATTGSTKYQLFRDGPWGLSSESGVGIVISRSTTVINSYSLQRAESINAGTGATAWSQDLEPFVSRIAADNLYAYYLASGIGVVARNRSDGVQAFVIDDPDAIASTSQAPVLTSNNALVSQGPYGLRVYDLRQRQIRGDISTHDGGPLATFYVAPVTGNNRIYACATSYATYMEIDEQTLSVERLITVGDQNVHEYCAGRMIATRNIVFLSTDKAVYAIDDHGSIVWTHPSAALIAFSPNGYLIVLESYFDPISRSLRSGRNLVAYRVT